MAVAECWDFSEAQRFINKLEIQVARVKVRIASAY
jgi:hypothetical protein